MLELERAAEEEQRREDMMARGEEPGEGMEQDLDEAVPEAEPEQSDAEGEGERDLDDDIPDGDAENEDESEIGNTMGDVTFNEESFIEGSMVQADVEQMLDMEEDAAMQQSIQDVEHDLDDDVPEAGAYEHTDTEIEDSTTDLGDFRAAARSSLGGPASDRRISNQSFADSSILVGGGSSLMGSSPAPRGRSSMAGPSAAFGIQRTNGRQER
jgi:hypothetical protein